MDQAILDRLRITADELAAFCHRWKITEFALFGSVLRDDFRPDSDIDVLVTFEPDAKWSLLDMVPLEEELTALVGRKVDVMTKRGIERSKNANRRERILSTARTIYAA